MKLKTFHLVSLDYRKKSRKFASVYIKKYMMNREVGFVRRVLSVLEKYDVSFEHIVSGIDDIDVIFKLKTK